MRVLVTNDDGIHALGIGVLAAELRDRDFDVVCVAPLSESSGASAGLGALEPRGTLPVSPVEMHAAPGVEAHAVTGTPSMCVLAGLTGAFGARPDVVVSGINHGHNLGRAVIHSGTVGAALTAQMLGVPALAISGPTASESDVGEGPTREHRRRAAALAGDLLARLELWPKAALNVNVPAGAWTKMQLARLSDRGAIRLAVGDDHSMRVELETSLDSPDPGNGHDWPSDFALIGRGIATITPLCPIGVADDAGQLDDFVARLN